MASRFRLRSCLSRRAVSRYANGSGRRLLGTLLLIAASAHVVASDTVACHVTYGGTTSIVEASPTASPYTVKPVEFGSYMLFRIVFRTEPADLASIKIYAYADHDDERPIIQQATYAYPPTTQRSHGFTGQQRVYEPRRGGELDYWCELRKAVSK